MAAEDGLDGPLGGLQQQERICWSASPLIPPSVTASRACGYGKPCVRGTRLTVGDVLGTLASGCTEAELLED
ncbi:MAG: DUF433 domain-containing protein, partial [Synechococcaceae cyanobacterium]|nr:DUF433 domain-containing protein [Synechococcaceae cyanobacterium]